MHKENKMAEKQKLVTHKLFYINSLQDANAHEIIDTSLMSYFALHYDVTLYATKQKTKSILHGCEKLIGKKVTEQITVRNLKIFFCLWNPIKLLIAAIKNVFIVFKGEKGTIFFFAFEGSYISPFFINAISRLMGHKVIICCHRGLDILQRRKYRFWEVRGFLLSYFHRKTKKAKNLRFLVLGDFILDSLKLELSGDELKHFISVDHPYFSLQPNEKKEKEKEKRDEVKIGVVGGIREEHLENVLSFLKEMSIYENITLFVISKTFVDRKHFLKNKNIVFLNSNNVGLDRNTYDAYIEDMDYLYLPYNENEYKFSVSGAIFESLFKNKPIIARKNAHFNYLFNKYGKFGYLYETNEELTSILSLVHKKEDRYNFETTQITEKLLPSNIKINFRFE